MGRCGPYHRRDDVLVLVLDNLPVHHLSGLREWLVAQREVNVLVLPSYSPDFSFIEQAWSKLKTKLRTGAARSYEALKEPLYDAVDWISSAETRN